MNIIFITSSHLEIIYYGNQKTKTQFLAKCLIPLIGDVYAWIIGIFIVWI